MVESSASLRPEATEYETRTPDLWAMLGLVLGLFSVLASAAQVLLIIPVLGILVSAVALARLKRDPLKIGRKAALAGIGLSAIFGIFPLSLQASTYLVLRDQPRAMADQFLEYLREQSPEKAVMLHFSPENRKPMDDQVWNFLRTTDEARRVFTEFVERPMVHTMLVLGDRAQIRFYKVSMVIGDSNRALVSYIYTVTYDDEQGKKKTFLIRVIMERKTQKNPALNPWRVGDIMGDVDPKYY